MNITKLPTNIVSLKFDRGLGLYGGFKDIGAQWYNGLRMVEKLIGYSLSKNEIVNVYITKETIFGWDYFHIDKYKAYTRKINEDDKYYYKDGWIYLQKEFVLKYKLQNGFYLKVQKC